MNRILLHKYRKHLHLMSIADDKRRSERVSTQYRKNKYAD